MRIFAALTQGPPAPVNFSFLYRMDTGLFLEIFPDFFLIIMGLMRLIGVMRRMRKGGGKRTWGLFAIFSDDLLDFRGPMGSMGVMGRMRERSFQDNWHCESEDGLRSKKNDNFAGLDESGGGRYTINPRKASY